MFPAQVATIAIVAHTARIPQAEALAQATGAEHICVDDGLFGCDENHYRAWGLLADSELPWAVVLEDDAVPVPGFPGQLISVLSCATTPLVSLYLGRNRPPSWQNWIRQATLRAEVMDACFIEAKPLLHCVGVAMHTNLITAMLRQTRHLKVPVDEAITVWARRERPPMGISYCWPSIVDHLDGPTLIDHHDGMPRIAPRTAWAVGTRRRWHATQVPLRPRPLGKGMPA